MAAAGGRRRACALGPGAAGGRRGRWGRGAGWSAAELLPPPQPLPPQRRGHVVWCVGRGEEEEGVKPREETGERHHTHGTRWPERQQHPELSGVPPRPRGPPAGGELRPDGPQARGSGAAAAEARRAARVGVRARGRGSQGGRAHDAESAAAVAASEASPGPGGWTRRGREARAGGPARDSDLGDQEVPAAALGPGEWLPGSFYCPLSLGGKAKCP
ncbi:uncharacterized protein LOC144330127 isoform X3 [Macaca mulatta]